MVKTRIVIGGISHESNTFNMTRTRLEDFKIICGNDLLRDEAAIFLSRKDVEVIPTLYAKALPSGPVEKTAYIHMKEDLLRRIEETGRIDGVCLFLHGAMEVDEIGESESDLVKSIREIVGEETLISVSLDLHGNISRELIEFTDILTAYRTAPHIDSLETRKRAASLLVECFRRKIKPKPVIVKPPVILPGEFVVTDIEPASSLYSKLRELDESPSVLNSSLLVGMAWADTPSTSASVIVVAKEKKCKEAYEKACELARSYWEKREEFHLEVESGTIEETVRMAKASSKKPVFISDSGDNVTAGAAGDIPIFVEHLLSMNVTDAVVGGIIDPEAVKLCREAGVGSRLRIEIGGKIDRINGYPIDVEGRVVSITGDGAVFRAGGIDILLTERRIPWTTVENFKAFGVDPRDYKIVVVKKGYLTADLRRVAALSLIALSPGCTNLRIDQLDYKKITRPIYPLDKDFHWEPEEYQER